MALVITEREVAVRAELANIIAVLVREGFTAKSASNYAETGDPSVLRHTGLVSVQLYRNIDLLHSAGGLSNPTR